MAGYPKNNLYRESHAMKRHKNTSRSMRVGFLLLLARSSDGVLYSNKSLFVVRCTVLFDVILLELVLTHNCISL